MTILIDTREQRGDYIKDYFDSIGGIKSSIVTFPQETGCDYLIIGEHDSIAVQRKVTNEVLVEMQQIREEIIPNLIDFSDNPVLLIEENHQINRHGWIMRKEGEYIRETGVVANAYYNFLNAIRKMGVMVVCTRSLDHSIWWMASTHTYISNEHYPKPKKGFIPISRAIGMLCCVNGIGAKKARQLLKQYSIAELVELPENKIRDILTDNQMRNFVNVLAAKYDEQQDGESQ